MGHCIEKSQKSKPQIWLGGLDCYVCEYALCSNIFKDIDTLVCQNEKIWICHFVVLSARCASCLFAKIVLCWRKSTNWLYLSFVPINIGAFIVKILTDAERPGGLLFFQKERDCRIASSLEIDIRGREKTASAVGIKVRQDIKMGQEYVFVSV